MQEEEEDVKEVDMELLSLIIIKNYNFPFKLEIGESTLAHDKWKWEDRNVEGLSSYHMK